MSKQEHLAGPPSLETSAEDSSAAPAAAEKQPPNINSWPFWKKRIARALIVGALVLTATQILPAVPEDQRVEVRVDRGVLNKVQITYFAVDDADGAALTGTQITLAAPGKRAYHSLKLSDGNYLVKVQAVGEDVSGKTHLWQKETPLTFSEGTVVIHLD